MNATHFFMIVLALLIVLTMVVAYNMYQENQYRKKIRSQFGHADQDALMNTHTTSVRDGQTSGSDGVRALKAHVSKAQSESPNKPNEAVSTALAEQAVKQPETSMDKSDTLPEIPITETTQSIDAAVNHEKKREPLVFREPVADSHAPSEAVVGEPQPESETTFELTAPTVQKATAAVTKSKTLFLGGEQSDDLTAQLDELARNELIWFDKRFDYMAYVALNEAKELQAIPRLSVRQRFQIIGCTRDGRFQAAEPIPGVLYQAFVIGLQSISRNGLAEISELRHFAEQVRQFAQNMNGQAMVEDATGFLMQAEPLDELCARVDQTIAIHLVSRTDVSGVELRQALARHGFELQTDGTFAYAANYGEVLYSIAPLDGSMFTEALLDSQAYKGFSMLFDITRVPSGERNFNQFMSLAVKLSGDLALDLVDDQLQPLSTEWLKEVRDYVGVLQNEMQSVGITAGSTLAKRVFA